MFCHTPMAGTSFGPEEGPQVCIKGLESAATTDSTVSLPLQAWTRKSLSLPLRSGHLLASTKGPSRCLLISTAFLYVQSQRVSEAKAFSLLLPLSRYLRLCLSGANSPNPSFHAPLLFPLPRKRSFFSAQHSQKGTKSPVQLTN